MFEAAGPNGAGAPAGRELPLGTGADEPGRYLASVPLW
jgi:hypothetical protein